MQIFSQQLKKQVFKWKAEWQTWKEEVLGPGGTRDCILVSYTGGKGPSTWTIIPLYFPRHINREEDWRQRSWNSNVYSYVRGRHPKCLTWPSLLQYLFLLKTFGSWLHKAADAEWLNCIARASASEEGQALSWTSWRLSIALAVGLTGTTSLS